MTTIIKSHHTCNNCKKTCERPTRCINGWHAYMRDSQCKNVICDGCFINNQECSDCLIVLEEQIADFETESRLKDAKTKN